MARPSFFRRTMTSVYSRSRTCKSYKGFFSDALRIGLGRREISEKPEPRCGSSARGADAGARIRPTVSASARRKARLTTLTWASTSPRKASTTCLGRPSAAWSATAAQAASTASCALPAPSGAPRRPEARRWAKSQAQRCSVLAKSAVSFSSLIRRPDALTVWSFALFVVYTSKVDAKEGRCFSSATKASRRSGRMPGSEAEELWPSGAASTSPSSSDCEPSEDGAASAKEPFIQFRGLSLIALLGSRPTPVDTDPGANGFE
mmetsp:Transcript_32658/g.113031  ORF Transcript_32658/g.113031 Transcript_32658/m.113031 type:complete len:262 (-) Transcript_32658:166-951(-)